MYFVYIRQPWIFVSSLEHCTGTSIGHLSVSCRLFLNVTVAKVIAYVCSFINSTLVIAFPRFFLYLTSRQVTCVHGQCPVAMYTNRGNAALDTRLVLSRRVVIIARSRVLAEMSKVAGADRESVGLVWIPELHEHVYWSRLEGNILDWVSPVHVVSHGRVPFLGA